MSKKTIADNVRNVPKLVKIASELHKKLKRETTDVVEIGRLLASAKNELEHGEFLPRLESEFSLTEKTANRYMAVQCGEGLSKNSLSNRGRSSLGEQRLVLHTSDAGYFLRLWRSRGANEQDGCSRHSGKL
jgi:hypothetical protein